MKSRSAGTSPAAGSIFQAPESSSTLIECETEFRSSTGAAVRIVAVIRASGTVGLAAGTKQEV